MASATAPNFETASEAGEEFLWDPHGVQSLLQPKPQRSHLQAQIGAAAVYALILGAIVTLSFKTAEAPIEEQQVIELAPIPAEEPPPPEDVLPQLQEPLPEPPPPPMMDPIAPIEEVKPKPIVKPIQKVEKKVETPVKPRTDAKPRPDAKPARTPAAAAARTDVPAMRAPAAPPGATPSAIANQFHTCMQRAASSFEAPLPGRVSYHATFSATGSLTSYSISPSGKGPLDSIAGRLGGRCGSVQAPGKPVSLSGVISFSP